MVILVAVTQFNLFLCIGFFFFFHFDVVMRNPAIRINSISNISPNIYKLEEKIINNKLLLLFISLLMAIHFRNFYFQFACCSHFPASYRIVVCCGFAHMRQWYLFINTHTYTQAYGQFASYKCHCVVWTLYKYILSQWDWAFYAFVSI